MAERDSVDAARQRHAAARERLDAGYSDDAWQAWQAAAADYSVALRPTLRRFRRGRTIWPPTVESMRELATNIESAMHGVPQTWRIDGSLPTEIRDDFGAQVGWWHELMRALYDPIYEALSQARVGDRSGVETLIRFLEADVYCDRSGYAKDDVISVLTRLELDYDWEQRLRIVALTAVDGPDRREFRAFVRLARRFETPGLRAAIVSRLESPVERIARHAHWMLTGIRAEGPRPPHIATSGAQAP